MSGTSDLAELDRALNGAIGKQLMEVFHKPLPLSAGAFDKDSGSPLLQQVLLVLAMPGKTVRVDLPKLLKSGVPISADPSLAKPGPSVVVRRELSLAVGHRPAPLTLVVLQPQANPNGRLVVISHGLWDTPASFEGWARHLASSG